MKKLFLLILVLSTFFFTNCRYEVIIEFDASVLVTVNDDRGKPIEGASLNFKINYNDSIYDYHDDLLTDSSGMYLFDIHDSNPETRYHFDKNALTEREKYMLTDHVYELTISKQGYIEQTNEIILTNGDELSVRYVLKEN